MNITITAAALAASLLGGVSLCAAPDPPGVTVDLKMNPTGAARMGPYTDQVLHLEKVRQSGLRKEPVYHGKPLYGALILGSDRGRPVFFALDRSEGADPLLYVDSNGDGDLTNDRKVVLDRHEYLLKDDRSGREVTRLVYTAHVEAPARYGEARSTLVPVQLGVSYMVETPAALTNPYATQLLYHRDYLREGTVTLGGRSMKMALVDDRTTGRFDQLTHTDPKRPNVTLLLDLNGDGRFDRKTEAFDAAKPFQAPGGSYQIASVDPPGAKVVFKAVEGR